MLLYRFRIWVDEKTGDMLVDDDVYRQEILDEKMNAFHQPNEVYRVVIPAESEDDPFIHVIMSDNREKIIEYVRGLSLGIEIIPKSRNITIKTNPFRVAVPKEDADVVK